MSETIQSIVSGHFEAPQNLLGGTFSVLALDKYEGYIITTDQQIIYLGIHSRQQCCENFGYFMSEDDVQFFIGAELLDVKITDTAKNKASLEDHFFNYGGNTLFVDIETTKGVLQFVAYNEHNGYYGHNAIVFSTQLQIEKIL